MAGTPDWIQIVASNTSNPIMLNSLYICNSIRKRENEMKSDQPMVSKKTCSQFYPFLSKYICDDDSTIHIDKENIDGLRHELFKAVVDKDYDQIKFILKHVEDASLLWTSGDCGFENILHFAARTGQKYVIELFLENDASALSVNYELSTALHTAARVGHLEICKILLRYRSIIDFRDDLGCTPLMLGVHSLEITELLLTYGSDVNMKDNYGYSALIRACAGGHCSSARLLLKAGADAKAHDIYGYTALMMTVRQNDIPLMKELLFHGSDPCSRSFSGVTALHEAGFMSKGHHIIKELTKAGCYTEAKNSKGQTPLIYAIQMARPNNILCLIQANCNVNFTFNMFEQSFTPFSLCLRDCLQIAERSEEYDLNDSDKETFSSLLYAMYVLLLAGGQILYSSILGLQKTFLDLEVCFKLVFSSSPNLKYLNYLKFLIFSIHNSMSLSHLCRIKIRNTVRHSIQLESLIVKLPITLKQYLLFLDNEYE